MIGFQTYAMVNNRPNIGSSRIRADWLIKYWDEAEHFVNGKKYEAIIFQKVYPLDYLKIYDGIKIIDICDPDWMEHKPVMEAIRLSDAVTCPTEEMQKFISGYVDVPVMVIPDRHDLEWYEPKPKHEGKAKEVCWFGYSHNAHCLKSIRDLLRKHDMTISIIADDMVVLSTPDKEVKERWTQWKAETVNDEIIKSDFIVMPGSRNPNWRFKSNNKTISSWALKMPVACDIPTFERFIDPIERQKEVEVRYEEVKKHWQVKESIKQMKQLITELKCKK